MENAWTETEIKLTRVKTIQTNIVTSKLLKP